MSLMLNITSIFAADADGSVKYVTVYGHRYSYNSSVYNDSTETWGYGRTSETNSNNVPTGYMGINARLYKSSGTLVKSSGWKYNTKPLGGLSVNSGSTTTKGTYYAKSQMQFYNGNGYNTYTSNATPNIQRAAIHTENYKINKYGLTYGSDYFAKDKNDSPDLIRVLGQNDIEGYVYSNELNKEPKNINEVKNYMNEVKLGYTIPVYDENGENVIDSFFVYGEETAIVY
ncbi:hypothetical protein MBAG_03145 [Coprobacillus sp. D7]|nr:hypothetical protein MBAG_03145 [Coprobacillus sp. D7]